MSKLPPLPERQDDRPSPTITDAAKAKMRRPKTSYTRREFNVDDFRYVGEGLYVDRQTRAYLVAQMIDKKLAPVGDVPASVWLREQAKP